MLVDTIAAADQSHLPKEPRRRPISLIQKAWNQWRDTLPVSARAKVDEIGRTGTFRPQIPYFKYDNLLILSEKIFKKEPWQNIFQEPSLQPYQYSLWENIARSFGVGHIGLNAPIALTVQLKESLPRCGLNGNNTLRSPTSFQALYGDFGCPDASTTSPSTESNVFWASATQYGIKQVWYPLQTMFSNGNIEEKQRVRRFETGCAESTAVDLYAGIGYFAFSYRKDVAQVVLCWEINEWSVEGFKRGAMANGWKQETRIVHGNEAFQDLEGWTSFPQENFTNEMGKMKEGLVMFAESNEQAAARLSYLRKSLPPVRHVNCGYLPTSAPSWETAVQVLDPEVGGWIHAHENVAVQDIGSRAIEVVHRFKELAYKYAGKGGKVSVECMHTARVKTYAPGVMHCVFDIQIIPRPETPR